MRDWTPVSKSKPCPVCGKPDVCAVSNDGTSVACFRVDAGCKRHADGKPVTFTDGMGWVHALDAGKVRDTSFARAEKLRPIERNAEIVDWEGVTKRYMGFLSGERLEKLAASLGLKWETLAMLWVGWSAEHNAYTWPMVNGSGKFVGIRLRGTDGRKWAITGSKNGLFHLPLRSEGPVVICEGPTDAGAVFEMGFHAIGRASCNSGLDAIRWALRPMRDRLVLIVADNDGPGLAGAHRLADELCAERSVKVITPGWSKDVREWAKEGWKRDWLLRLAETQRTWTPKEQEQQA